MAKLNIRELKMSTEINKSRIYGQNTSQLFALVFYLFIVTIFLSMINYGEPFIFSEYAISDLGTTLTKTNQSNTVCFAIFGIGMISCGMIMLKLFRKFINNPNIMNVKIKQYLLLLTAFGFFLILYPYNLNNTIHSIGAGLIVGSLWALEGLFLIELVKLTKALKYFLYLSLLQVSVLGYAYLYFINSPLRQNFQKLSVFFLLLIMKIITSGNNKLSLSELFPSFNNE